MAKELTDREKVLAWLSYIGETDPRCIAEVIEQCSTDVEARRSYVAKWEAECPH